MFYAPGFNVTNMVHKPRATNLMLYKTMEEEEVIYYNHALDYFHTSNKVLTEVTMAQR